MIRATYANMYKNIIRKKMKKQTNNFKNILFITFLTFVLSFSIVLALDEVAENITNQSATATGSNNSVVIFLTGWTDDPQYINAWNNSTVIWNYFRGYYYDSVYGYFQLDWDDSGDIANNVHITGSTDRCSSGYGYKIGWYAYSEYYGFVDFNYDSSVYVYYCLSDQSMYGHAYSELVWFQNFEWIWFEILTTPINTTPETTTSTWFVNDRTNIIDVEWNPGPNVIGSDVFEFKDTGESIFYIIK